ncbi:glutathione S-transferase T3-like [Salvia hispanica]|uniref:glutathione S-transferase T3-like n=1 Tax=Salvia hispanica TaxID=49212 RepID=UPI002009B282|nr:glutathione S-transferase T3-like [Salvia hispanica]
MGRGIDPNYGDAVYRPEMMTSTPDTYGSTTIPVTDPSFSTKEYEVEEMHPSPPKEKGKGKTKAKGRAAEPSAPAPKGRKSRTHYMATETLALASFWVDIDEDLVVGNNERKIGFWTRIAQRYNQDGVKHDGAPTHKAPELRKNFERVMFHIGKFHGIYENNCRMMSSGMGYDDVRDLSQAQLTRTVSSVGFHHCEAYMKLKDQSKFRAVIEAALALGSRRTRLIESQSLSSGGPESTDFTESVEVVQLTARRPMGVKTAKAAAKGKSQASASQSTDGDAVM